MASSTAKSQPKVPESRVPKQYRAPLSLLVAAICVVVLVYLASYSSYIGVYFKILYVFLALGISGLVITYIYGAIGSYGLFLLKTEKGIGYIDYLSKKYEKPWKAIVDWGFVMSFGILTPFIFKKYVSRKMLALGLLSIIAFQFLISLYLPAASSLISVPQVSAASSSYTASAPGATSGITLFGELQLSYLGILFMILSLIGGFALFLISELALIAGIIIHGIGVFAVATVTSPTSAAASTSSLPGPAGVPVIAIAFLNPSIIIPLVLALALLITLHEFSHGVIARQNKIKVKSIGAIFFGIMPLGAFVEPDEKAISKLPVKAQDKISIAGISFNLFLTLIFLALFVVMIYVVLPPLTTTAVYIEGVYPGSPAQNVLSPGEIVTSWNGHQIQNISDLKAAAASDLPYSNVTVSTKSGTYSITANATGKIGVLLSEETTLSNSGIEGTIANFLYEFFGLSFLLNFYVAIFNLLPIPMLDGWRIFKLKLGKNSMKVIAILVILMIVMLLIPWIWSV